MLNFYAGPHWFRRERSQRYLAAGRGLPRRVPEGQVNANDNAVSETVIEEFERGMIALEAHLEASVLVAA